MYVRKCSSSITTLQHYKDRTTMTPSLFQSQLLYYRIINTNLLSSTSSKCYDDTKINSTIFQHRRDEM